MTKTKVQPMKLALALASLLGAGFVLWQGLAPVLGEPEASADGVVEDDPWADTSDAEPGAEPVWLGEPDASAAAARGAPAVQHETPDWELLFQSLLEREELMAQALEASPEPAVESSPMASTDALDGPDPATSPAVPRDAQPAPAAPDHRTLVARLDLSGIASTPGGRRAALLEGRVLHEGDDLPGTPYTLRTIDPDRVLLTAHGVDGTFTLLLRPLRPAGEDETSAPPTTPTQGATSTTGADPSAPPAVPDAAPDVEALSNAIQTALDTSTP